MSSCAQNWCSATPPDPLAPPRRTWRLPAPARGAGPVPALQTWMTKAAPQAVAAASSPWVAVFNLSIGLGALAGGVIVDTLTLQGVLWLGRACALIAALAPVRRAGAPARPEPPAGSAGGEGVGGADAALEQRP